MSRILYNLAGYLFLPIVILRLIIKSLNAPAHRQRLYERLGWIEKISDPTVWVHCVSVGEFRAATPLIDQLSERYPKHRILVTTTTPTGSEAVTKHYQNKVVHLYFPFDLLPVVRRYIGKINLKMCILLETEIWPNLIQTLNKNNIPILLINARLSERSFKKYQQFMPKLLMQTLKKISLIAVQNQNYLDRFARLGANPNKIINMGNLKFEQSPPKNKALVKQLKTRIGKRKIVAFASTHKGEEAQIIKAYLARTKPINALMLIIPRHPERFDEVYKLAKSQNITMVKRSDNKPCKNAQMMLGNSMGEMMAYFEVADIVFMGGSLSKTGGHNMLEPAELAKPILFGKNTFNFTEISSDLIQQQGAIIVQNADALFEQIARLLADDKSAQLLGENAKKYHQSKQGASENILPHIELFL